MFEDDERDCQICGGKAHWVECPECYDSYNWLYDENDDCPEGFGSGGWWECRCHLNPKAAMDESREAIEAAQQAGVVGLATKRVRMQCPFDDECEGLAVEKVVVYCFAHDCLEFDGRVWQPVEAPQHGLQRTALPFPGIVDMQLSDLIKKADGE